MSGFAGFINPYEDSRKNFNLIDSMLRMITYSDNYTIENSVVDRFVTVGRSEYSVLRSRSVPYHADGVTVWMIGEFFNLEDIHFYTHNSYTKLLWHHYIDNSLHSFLQSVDGSFAACVYDSSRGKILLISDRFGSRHLFWTGTAKSFVWASETKAVILYPGYSININRDGLEDFLYIGYPLGNRTLLDGVQMLPAATILVCDMRDTKIISEQYWGWNNQKETLTVTELEMADELGELFKKAVKRRCESQATLVVLLSGGYDSRAILAALPEEITQVHAYTFGEEGSKEIEIAKKYAAKKNAIHLIEVFKSSDRMTSRIKQIWRTDGHLSILHMHGGDASEEFKKSPSIALHGLAGGEVIGGRIYMYSLEEVDTFIEKEIACPEMPDQKRQELRESILQYGSFQEQLVDNYVRKFLLTTLRLGQASGTHMRTPFIDIDFMGYVRLIPLELKKERKIYQKMLQLKFPEYFPIHIQQANSRFPFDRIRQSFIYKTLRKYRRNRSQKKKNVVTQRVSAKQKGFIENETTRQFIKDMLLAKDAYTVQYIPEKRITDWFEQLLEDKAVYAELIGRLLTVEIWLKLLYDKKIDGHFELDESYILNQIDIYT